jgi:hypothetical protein
MTPLQKRAQAILNSMRKTAASASDGKQTQPAARYPSAGFRTQAVQQAIEQQAKSPQQYSNPIDPLQLPSPYAELIETRRSRPFDSLYMSNPALYTAAGLKAPISDEDLPARTGYSRELRRRWWDRRTPEEQGQAYDQLYGSESLSKTPSQIQAQKKEAIANAVWWAQKHRNMAVANAKQHAESLYTDWWKPDKQNTVKARERALRANAKRVLVQLGKSTDRLAPTHGVKEPSLYREQSTQ